MSLTYGEQRTSRQKKVDAKVLARVKKGMALLEKTYGPDWVEHIDLKVLDLELSNHCVLGQLYGSYPTGLSLVFPNGTGGRGGAPYGFAIMTENESYDELTDTWRQMLTPIVTKGEER